MNDNLIELNKSYFWLTCVVAMAVLVPLTQARSRKLVLAGLNLGFLILLLRTHAVSLLAALLVVYLLLQAIGHPRLRGGLSLALALAVFGLFVLHKRPELVEPYGWTVLGHVMSVIGYSYIALRMADMLRAVFEGREPPPDPASLVNYLIPFHMLAAGPVQAYSEFVAQPAVPKLATSREVLVGMERIAQGVFKKFVLAFILEKMFLTQFRADGPYFLLELQVFFIWLYLDFSAYSDIAVGVGALIGVATPENFNRPFLARNISEFWERWHISLSQFIRRNIFMPLQIFLMRKTDAQRPLLCATTAIMVTFLLCGLWHGLNLQFLIYGAVQGFGLVIAHVYGYVLQKRLGSKGMKTYRANPWIRAAATFLTFEYQACSLLPLFLRLQ